MHRSVCRTHRQPNAVLPTLTSHRDDAWQGVEEGSLCTEATAVSGPIGGNVTELPVRPAGPGLQGLSNVLGSPLRCYPNAPRAFHDLQVHLLPANTAVVCSPILYWRDCCCADMQWLLGPGV